MGDDRAFSANGLEAGATEKDEPAIGCRGDPVYGFDRFQHHLDDGGVFQKPGYGRAEHGAQHACAALDRFRFVAVISAPFPDGAQQTVPAMGLIKRACNRTASTTI